MSVPVFARQFDSEAASLRAYAAAVATYVFDSDLNVGFLRGVFNRCWTVFTVGVDATDAMVEGGTPVVLPDVVADAVRLRRAAASGMALLLIHHDPPLILPL